MVAAHSSSHLADLARRQLQQRHAAFFRNQLRLRSGRARHLPALARLQFDIVHHGAGRNILERQRIADQDVGLRSRGHLAADLEAHRGQDVALLAVDIMQQRDARAAVGIVFDGRDHRHNPVLVALEIDLAIGLLVSAAAEARRNPARAAASAASPRLPFTRLFSGVCLVISSRDTTVWKRRVGVVGLKLFTGMLDLRVLRHLLAGLQAHPGFFPVRAIARKLPAPPQLARRHRGAHFRHFHLESRFDGMPDLGLIGIDRHFESTACGRSSFLVTPFSVTSGRLITSYKFAIYASASDNFRAAVSLSSTWLCCSRS